MWLLILLCTVISVSGSSYLDTFRKCCPKNQTLVKVIDSDGFDKYECLDSDSDRTFSFRSSTSTSFVTEGVTVEYGIPSECELEMIHIDDNVIQISEEPNHCYDRLVLEVINGTAKQIIPKTIGLLCTGTDLSDGTDVKIQNIRKCCPSGLVYDSENHLCRKVDEDYNDQWFIRQLKAFGGKVFEFENGLYCKSAEYDVQLKDEKFSLTLEGSTLKILSRSNPDSSILSPLGNWCVDREFSSKRLLARVCTQDCPSLGAYCIRKCCPIGQHYKPFVCRSSRSACVPTTDDETMYDLSEYINPIKKRYGIGDTVGLSAGLTCPKGKWVMNRSSTSDEHRLTKDAHLFSNIGIDTTFCLEMFDWRACGLPAEITGVVCFRAVTDQNKNFRLSFVLIIVSCVCLALTLAVYCSISELRNLHGRNIICHVSMMLFAFSCLARVQYQYVPDKKLCAVLGYGIYFGFVAAFVWLNVMCFDIWWTFGSVKNVQPMNKGRTTRRRFIWYSVYAWGVTIVFTLTMFLLDKYPISAYLDANIGTNLCWFGTIQNTEEDWPHYIFFVIPMGLVSGVNFILWLLTARHCARVKSEVHRLQAGSVGERAKKRFRIDKANFILTGKLWVVMGAGWISELISTLVQPGWVFTIIDSFNELQGLFIFIILIFKPKLYYLIRKKLGFSRTSKDPRLAKPDAQKNGQSSTARTSSTFLSRTISTDDRNQRISVPNDNAKQT